MLALVSPSVSFDVQQLPNPDAQLFSPPPGPSPFYIGLIPLMLALLSFGRLDPRFRRLRMFFAVTTAFLFLKLIGAVPAQWIGLLPVFGELHFIPYFCGALTLGFAGLAGIGVQSVLDQRGERTLLLGTFFVLAIALCVLRFDQTESFNSNLQTAALWSAIARYGIEVTRLSLLAVAFLAVLYFAGRNRNGYVAGFCLLVLVFLDLASLDMHQRFLRADVWAAQPPFARFLRADKSKFRVHSAPDSALPANVSQAMNLDALSSRMAFNSTRYSELMGRYFEAPLLPYPLAKSAIPSSRVLLDILNVKYLVALSPNPAQLQQIAEAELVPVFQSGDYQVFQNLKAWNRAYLATSITVVDNKEQEIRKLADLHPGEVLLEKYPPLKLTSDALSQTVDGVRYDFGDITAHVRTSQPGLFVLGENYAPGWRASVGGKAVSIYHANYAFQAVEVPAGYSDVHFRYTPPGLDAGLLVSLIAGALTVFLCFTRGTNLADPPQPTTPRTPTLPASREP